MPNSAEFLVMDLFLLKMAQWETPKNCSSYMLLPLKELSLWSQIYFLCLFKSSWKARFFQIQDDSESKP